MAPGINGVGRLLTGEGMEHSGQKKSQWGDPAADQRGGGQRQPAGWEYDLQPARNCCNQLAIQLSWWWWWWWWGVQGMLNEYREKEREDLVSLLVLIKIFVASSER